MAKNSIDQQIRDRIDVFVEELSGLVREAAIEAVEDALRNGGGRTVAATARSSAGRTSRAAKAARRSRAKGAGKRTRRSSDEIAKLTASVLAHVKANPGIRMEGLAKGLRKESKDLRRSIQDLLAAKKLRTKGQKRATAYYAGAGRTVAQKKATRKASRKKAAKKS